MKFQCNRCGAAVDSTRLLTGSADSSAKLWDVETGANLFTFKHKAPCKAVAFSLGEGLAAIATDPFMTTTPAVHLVRIADDATEQSADAVQARHGMAWHDLPGCLHTAGRHCVAATACLG